VEVLIGSVVSQVPPGLRPTTTALLSGPPSASTGTAAGSNGTGGTVTVPKNAPYGIPCVY
jgi:hypothetical protein